MTMKFGFCGIAFLGLLPTLAGAQSEKTSASFQITPKLETAVVGFRYDDNIQRSVTLSEKNADVIYTLQTGALLKTQYDIFSGTLQYHLGADQYQTSPSFNNIKNDFGLFLSANPGQFNFFGKADVYLRNSQDNDFDYLDTEYLGGIYWAPEGPWNYEANYKNYTRAYYGIDPDFLSRNFTDQNVLVSVQREVDERVSVKLSASYNNRQFNRSAYNSQGTGPIPGSIQTDETWTGILNAHLFFESVLQDINIEEQRTNSNSYGFSNTVQSVSWAGVVRPMSTLYLQLFFRLYSKTYDVSPLSKQNLQVGFVDEDGQDLLSLQTTWEWEPQWMVSVGLSRVRNESTQPGKYYIKNMVTAQVRRNF